MPRLVDTTIRVLSQEPLAGLMPTADLLRLAELLDGAGFAYLEVSGGGVFDSAVRRGVESPWERIRALKARTTTPLALALRGRFLVGSRPVGGDFARRFVASAAAERHRRLPPARPAERRRQPARGGRGDRRRRAASSRRGCSTAAAATRRSSTRRSGCRELGAARILLQRPGRRCCSRTGRASSSPSCASVSGLPVGLYAQGAGGNALAAAIEAARAGADVIATRGLPGRADDAPRLGRGGRAGARRARPRHGRRHATRSGRAADLVDEHIGDEPVAPLAPRIAVRAAQQQAAGRARRGARRAAARAGRRRPARRGARRGRARCATRSARRRSRRRSARSSPRRRSSTCSTANRYSTMVDELRDLVDGPLRPHARAGRPGARARRRALLGDARRRRAGRPRRRCATRRTGSRRARRSCCCSRSSARRPSRCCARSASARAARSRSPRGGVDQARAERIREVVRIVQETGVGEITIEEDGMRVSVRRTAERGRRGAGVRRAVADGGRACRRSRRATTRSSASRARWSGRSTARPRPGAAPFVEEGDAVAPGQTLCILEAMKLMNEVKAEIEGDRPHDPRRQRRAGRVRPAPLRARAGQRPTARRGLRCSRASSSRTAARSPSG